jgi:hypothetical protein
MASKKKRRRKYVGKYPVNSRITIDYTGKKPSVKFAYPDKDKSSVFFSSAVFLPALFIVWVLAALISLNVHLPDARGYPQLEDCEMFKNHYENKTNIIGYTAKCNIEGEYYEMSVLYEPGNKILWMKDKPYLRTKNLPQTTDNGLLIFNFILLLLLFPIVFGGIYLFYTRTKLGQRMFPGINKKLHNCHYYTKFTKVPKNKKLELPLFKNIYMDYSAKKEFGKYLEKVEIREHPFNRLIKKKKKVRKKKRQVYLWKATFYFKKIPKEGYLEIWWT